VLLLVFNSCIDQLDIAPEGKLTMDEIFSDDEKVGAFLNSIYNYVPKKGKTEYHGRGPVVWCDDAWDADEFRPQPWGMSQLMYTGNVELFITNIPLQKAYILDSYWSSSELQCFSFVLRRRLSQMKPIAKMESGKPSASGGYYSELLRWYGMGLPVSKETHEF
jgi:hypothetical protein